MILIGVSLSWSLLPPDLQLISTKHRIRCRVSCFEITVQVISNQTLFRFRGDVRSSSFLEIQKVLMECVFVFGPPFSVSFDRYDINHFASVFVQPIRLPLHKVTNIDIETFHLELTLWPVMVGAIAWDDRASIRRFDFDEFIMFRDPVGRDT